MQTPGLAGLTALMLLAAGCAAPRSAPATGHAAGPVAEAPDMPAPFLFREAGLPAGFPPPGPVGQIIVKQYPPYRAAVVEARQPDGGHMDPNGMFGPLFGHIQRNRIPMTAPVEMNYPAPADAPADQAAEPVAMAFLYGDPAAGQPGADGPVRVVDLPARTVLSIGVRGSYSQEHFRQALARLQQWLEAHPGRYRPAGPPRYLGYNSPFVPWFLRYGEVQIPVTAAEEPDLLR